MKTLLSACACTILLLAGPAQAGLFGKEKNKPVPEGRNGTGFDIMDGHGPGNRVNNVNPVAVDSGFKNPLKLWIPEVKAHGDSLSGREGRFGFDLDSGMAKIQAAT